MGRMRKLTKSQAATLRKAAAVLRKSNDPDSQYTAKHLKGGLEVLNYLFEATLAAEKKVPKEYVVEPVTLTSTNKKTMGNLLAATWLLDIIKEQLQNGSISGKARV